MEGFEILWFRFLKPFFLIAGLHFFEYNFIVNTNDFNYGDFVSKKSSDVQNNSARKIKDDDALTFFQHAVSVDEGQPIEKVVNSTAEELISQKASASKDGSFNEKKSEVSSEPESKAVEKIHKAAKKIQKKEWWFALQVENHF